MTYTVKHETDEEYFGDWYSVSAGEQYVKVPTDGEDTDDRDLAHRIGRMIDPDRPKIVVLCGSTRFKAEYAQANQNLTLAGEIVLSCGVWGRVNTSHISSRLMTEEEKSAVDELHKRKIDLADHVVVIDPGGYIGDSTRSEIAYAIEQGKPISYWSKGDVPAAPPGDHRRGAGS